MKIVWVYYIAINLAAFVFYGADKFFAKKGMWRVPEKTLFGLAFLGGGFGALLGMEVFRHKTKHMSFKILVPLSCVIHAVLIFFIAGGKLPAEILEGII